MLRRVELPTLAVWVAVHAGWFAVTWWWAFLPWWAALGLAAPLVCWHSSYQHEAVHGHPTGVRWLDGLLAALPVGLWLPFGRYRDAHTAHHRADLTCPATDPESYYVSAADWHSRGRLGRAGLWLNATSAGRLLLGPARQVAAVWCGDARRIAGGDRVCLRYWVLHLVGVAVVVAWLVGVGVPLWQYLLFAVYPGIALTLLRSFAEHHAAPEMAARSAMVDTVWPMRLLYLNNTFHAVHHREPWVAWYQLPDRARRDGAFGYRVAGYLSVVGRHLVRAWDLPAHPGKGEPARDRIAPASRVALTGRPSQGFSPIT